MLSRLRPGAAALLLLLLAACSSAPSATPRPGPPPTQSAPTTSTTAVATTATTAQPAAVNSTTSTTRPRPAVTATTKAKAPVRPTTTTLPAGSQSAPANMVPVPDPGPAPLPTPTTTIVLLNPNETMIPPGVEQTPPYEPPTVISVGPATCTERVDAPNNFTVRFTATLTGGRYWTYIFGGTGATGNFEQGIGFFPDQPHADSFDYDLDRLYVRTPPGSFQQAEVPIHPALPVHCQSS